MPLEIDSQYDFFKAVQIDDDGNLLVSIVNPSSGGTSGDYLPLSGGVLTGGVTGTTLDIDVIQFELLTGSPAHSEGQIHWDDDDKTLEIDTEIVGVHIQIGQEQVLRATNKTGSLISDGTVVYVSGAQGNRPTITTADITDESSFNNVIGLTTHDIANNNTGYVTTYGLVRDFDCSSFAAGDKLYLSTGGTVTNVVPATPGKSVILGYALNTLISGTILVSIDTAHDYVPSTGGTFTGLITTIFDGGVSTSTYNETLDGVSGATMDYEYNVNCGFVGRASTPDKNSPYRIDRLSIGSAYTFSDNLNVLSIESLTQDSTVTLPSVPNYSFYVVKDKSGNAGTYPITVSAGDITINGEDCYIINLGTKPSITFLWDGSEYITI